MNGVSINSIGFKTGFWALAIVENHIVAFRFAFQFEIRSELLFSCLICPFVSPNFRLNDVFLSVMPNNQVGSASARRDLYVHRGSNDFDEFVQIGKE